MKMIICPKCKQQFGYSGIVKPNDEMTCPKCNHEFTYDDLKQHDLVMKSLREKLSTK